MSKSSKHNKRKGTFLDKTEVVVIASLIIHIVVSVFLFYLSEKIYEHFVIPDSLYHYSFVKDIVMIICFILNIVLVPTATGMFVCGLSKVYKKITALITFFAIILFLLPTLFDSCGLVADETSIKKVSFGTVKEEYLYSEIKLCKFGNCNYSGTAKGTTGIYYDLTFENGEIVSIFESPTFYSSNFKNDSTNIVKFNKLVTKDSYVIYDDKSDPISPFHFDNEDDYRYFEKFIDDIK